MASPVGALALANPENLPQFKKKGYRP